MFLKILDHSFKAGNIFYIVTHTYINQIKVSHRVPTLPHAMHSDVFYANLCYFIIGFQMLVTHS